MSVIPIATIVLRKGWGGHINLDNEFHSRVGGNDQIFNLLDANSPQADVSTVQARYRYEVARGFQFTSQEREDLVAFLEAL